MPDDPKRQAAAKAVKAAQKQFERDSKAAREARRKAFAQAQKKGSRCEISASLSGSTIRGSARSFAASRRPGVEIFSTL